MTILMGKKKAALPLQGISKTVCEFAGKNPKNLEADNDGFCN